MKMFNKLKTRLGVASALLLVCGNLSAINYTDNDNYGFLLAGGGIISSSFEISSPGDGSGTFGYDPVTQVIDSAMADFSFYANPNVTITIGGLSFTPSLTQIGPIRSLSANLGLLQLADLAIDGVISYQIVNNSGNSIRVGEAVLRAYVSDRPPLHVPDGGVTALLLGFGLVCLGTIRKFSKAV